MTPDDAPMRARGPSPFWGISVLRRPWSLHTGYGDELRIFPTRAPRLATLALLAGLCAVPFALTDYWLAVLNFSAIAAIGALGLNILTGFTGQISLGHAFFLGLGAYTAGYLGGTHGLPFVLWLPAAGILGTMVGLVIGPFALRLKGLYLALVTLGLVFVGEHLFLNLRSITGGPRGRAIPSPAVGGIDLSDIGGLSREQSFYLLLLPIVVIATLFAKNVVRTRPGRAFRAVRDREIAAAAIGVDLARTKVAAFALSSFYAAVAGALLGSYVRFATPGQFDLLLSIQYVAMIIVGGIGTIFGSILGALFVVMVPRVIDELGPYIPFVAKSATGSGLNLEILKQLLFGGLIVAFLMFEPLGLAGLWLRARVYFRSWPFSY